MQRIQSLHTLVLLLIVSPLMAADQVRGTYVEARTCQVYTGPCFANGEVGSVGKDAILAWRFTHGNLHGVNMTGQCVAVVVNASETLGFNGFSDAKTKKAILIVDASADSKQSAALQAFALQQTGLGSEHVVDVQRASIAMDFNHADLTAELTVGHIARLTTRKARASDCICSHESGYYPPLTKLKGCAPGVTIEGEVTARKLGTRWSIPDTRTAYMGTFAVDSSEMKLANN